MSCAQFTSVFCCDLLYFLNVVASVFVRMLVIAINSQVEWTTSLTCFFCISRRSYGVRIVRCFMYAYVCVCVCVCVYLYERV